MIDPIKLSVVIPCYQSERYLELNIETLYSELQLLSCSHVESFEIILVIDFSPDQTGRVADSLAERFPEIRVLHLSKNLGQHGATFAGIGVSSKPWVLTMDDDGQHPASEISKLISGIEKGIEVVYGISTVEEHGMFRSFFSRLVKSLFSWIFNSKGVRKFSAFRLFKRSILKAVDPEKFDRKIIDVELHRASDRFKQIAITMKKRESGASNYSFLALARLAIRMGIGYSRKR